MASRWLRDTAAVVLFSVAGAHAQQADSSFEACFTWAAHSYGVNREVLTAICRIESNLRADSIAVNPNGTTDYGICQINSVHLPELARYGVTPPMLLDACSNISIAAWLARRNIVKYGNTWHAYAAHHSKTPSLNEGYQIRIARELVRMGVLK